MRKGYESLQLYSNSKLRSVTKEEWESLSDMEIAKRHNATRQLVWSTRKEWHLPPAPKPAITNALDSITPEEWESLTVKELAEKYGTTTASVYGYARGRHIKYKRGRSGAKRASPLHDLPDEEWSTKSSRTIAEEHGYTEASIVTFRHRFKKPGGPRPDNPAEHLESYKFKPLKEHSDLSEGEQLKNEEPHEQ